MEQVMERSTIRPGRLVTLHTYIREGKKGRNVVHERLTLEEPHAVQLQGLPGGVQVSPDEQSPEQSKWETTKTVFKPEEYDAAVKVRSRARALISGVCSPTPLALLCPEERVEELTERVRAARKLAREFNETAELTEVQVRVIITTVAQSDVEAVMAIGSEVQQWIDKIDKGIAELDRESILNACDRLRDVGQMLSPEVQEKVQGLIKDVRKVGRQLKKAADVAAVEIDKQVLENLDSTRTLFLGIDEDAMFAPVDDDEDRALNLGHSVPEFEEVLS